MIAQFYHNSTTSLTSSQRHAEKEHPSVSTLLMNIFKPVVAGVTFSDSDDAPAPNFLIQCQAQFLTCYCFSVFLLLRTKKSSLAISFLVCVL